MPYVVRMINKARPRHESGRACSRAWPEPMNGGHAGPDLKFADFVQWTAGRARASRGPNSYFMFFFLQF